MFRRLPVRIHDRSSEAAGAEARNLGVVFGDIGTSPLYKLKTVLGGVGHDERQPSQKSGARTRLGDL
jgi:K+ transporter